MTSWSIIICILTLILCSGYIAFGYYVYINALNAPANLYTTFITPNISNDTSGNYTCVSATNVDNTLPSVCRFQSEQDAANWCTLDSNCLGYIGASDQFYYATNKVQPGGDTFYSKSPLMSPLYSNVQDSCSNASPNYTCSNAPGVNVGTCTFPNIQLAANWCSSDPNCVGYLSNGDGTYTCSSNISKSGNLIAYMKESAPAITSVVYSGSTGIVSGNDYCIGPQGTSDNTEKNLICASGIDSNGNVVDCATVPGTNTTGIVYDYVCLPPTTSSIPAGSKTGTDICNKLNQGVCISGIGNGQSVSCTTAGVTANDIFLCI